VLIHRWDEPAHPDDWWHFAMTPQLGHFVAPGDGRPLPVVVPTQFVMVGEPAKAEVWFHLARPNPVFDALEEAPCGLLSLAGEWAFIPSSWKAIGDEDPSRGIPTTYYAAVQLAGPIEVVDDPEQKAEILRHQLATFEPDEKAVDPLEHTANLRAIRGLRLDVEEVRAKFKYGGNVDAAHRQAVADRLVARGRPGDEAARRRVVASLSGREEESSG
jgi:transcriptional regulator